MNDLIEICFDSEGSTLYIGNIPIEQYKNKCRFKTRLENIYTLNRLHRCLGCNEAKNAGINRDKILDFIDSKVRIERLDKGTFKVRAILDIPFCSIFNFVWVNVAFMEDIKICFDTTDIQKEISIDLEKCTFNQSVEFRISNSSEYKVEANFKDNIFRENFKLLWSNASQMNFDGTQFLGECKFSDYNIENELQNIGFKNCVFGEKNSSKTINFQKCIFSKKTNFSNCKFYTDVYFNNSTFQDSVDFHECEFEKVACFYGVTFEKVPNFSQAIFKGNLNLVNTNLDFEFEDVEKKIKEEYSNHIGTEKEKFLDKFANDFRDSFRLFKNALIKDNNLLEASNHHRIELYCKEIELVSKNKEKGQIKDWIDSCVLKFYRHTSDHHTDLLKILNNIMMLIALFGIFSLVLVLIATNENPPETLGIAPHIWDFSQVFNIQNQQKIFYIVGQIPTSLEWNDYCGCKIWGEIFFILGFCAFFILGFLGLLCLQKCVYIYRCVIGLSYLIVLVILAVKPALLLPIFGKLLDESLKVNFPAFTSLSIVYAILMFLLLFSLQKTARKNSIVPS